MAREWVSDGCDDDITPTAGWLFGRLHGCSLLLRLADGVDPQCLDCHRSGARHCAADARAFVLWCFVTSAIGKLRRRTSVFAVRARRLRPRAAASLWVPSARGDVRQYRARPGLGASPHLSRGAALQVAASGSRRMRSASSVTHRNGSSIHNPGPFARWSPDRFLPRSYLVARRKLTISHGHMG